MIVHHFDAKRLTDEMSALGKITFGRRELARCDYNRNVRPLYRDLAGQSEAVAGARHFDIGKEKRDIQVMPLKHRHGFVAVVGFQRSEPSFRLVTAA